MENLVENPRKRKINFCYFIFFSVIHPALPVYYYYKSQSYTVNKIGKVSALMEFIFQFSWGGGCRISTYK